ncbi:gliding motility-associated C-terminal domain-containing protein [Hymenobacter weizhouensis]|uniref:gliding motility-associated C-terminal domain-containing protein n=1 Tax=Hymenobacter sp. YIM 151500-1 TaxID=2987689 RepID=UPI002226B743|nr:gliding motility-associated C-terminal domain-containing protein [Hymenobacter sp. YIM 151500-1]UYZ64804.1 gliding motility-associated C-terminal domain-containing protein [Hymenobacter sp. YIM 151500-1]
MMLPLPLRAGKYLLLLLLVALAWGAMLPAAQATHLRAGDIQAKTDTTAARNPRRIFFKMVLYQSNVNTSVDEDAVTIFFGDGEFSGVRAVKRFSKTSVGCDGTTFRNVYYFEHTYNAPGSYTVHYIGENRSIGVKNMSASETQSFYISTRITIDPSLGINRSPVLNAPAFDRASRSQVFLHNPAASDADGDSLAFRLVPSQHVPGGVDAVLLQTTPNVNRPQPQTTISFRYPDDPFFGSVQVPYAGPPVGRPGEAAIFQQDARTGQIVWNAPSQIGDYNIAFVVEEWRRVPGGRPQRIGIVTRDMQITVGPNNNLRPTVTVPAERCVIAGTPIEEVITATDPENNPVTLLAFGGMLPQPASFVQTQTGPARARGVFRWTPGCLDIRQEPHRVLFKAEDRPANNCGAALIDERLLSIRVIGPPPLNLRAAQSGNTAVLNWDAYSCPNPGAQMLIFRREGPSNFTPGPCETGIPASAGYVQIGTVPVGTRNFIDDRAGQGLERGKTYCYRIFVQFALPAGGQSIASQEACITLSGRSARFTNVTVDRTATAGQITVRWTKPTSSGGFLPPLGYRLFRAPGQSPAAAAFVQVKTTADLNDTAFVDTGVNTLTTAYAYRLEFFSNSLPTPGSPVLVENAGPASSIRLNATPQPLSNTITLNWTYNVPWDNSRRPTTVYRREPNGQFVPVAKVTGTTTSGTFTDRGTTASPLVKGRVYCYYVKTNGTYNAALPDSLINLSQELCVPLQSVPCTPVLTLRPTNCDSLASRLFELPATPPGGQRFTNFLSWTLSNQPVADCGRDIASYILYYAPNATDSLRVLTTVPGTQTTYAHTGLESAQGCYAVQAVDVNGVRSARSNIACNDNCLLFLLPNIFTPNGDQKNDTFRPKVYSPVERTNVKIFNRWGTKVYESDKDPLINWDGGGTSEGGRGTKVSDGMYFYQAEVEFRDANRTKRTFKGWVQLNR